jgi:hypothetical protein
VRNKSLFSRILAAGKAAAVIKKKFSIPHLLATLFFLASPARTMRRVKLYRIFFGMLVINVIVGILKPLPLTFAASPDLDTSVVTLSFKSGESVIEKDPFFEILDLQSYILLPLTKLAARLEISFDYQREKNTLLLETAKTKHQVRIDLNKGAYLAGEESRWTDQTPFLFNNEFYLSPLCYEYLTEVKIDWDFQYQEVTITGNWPVKVAITGTGATGGATLPGTEKLTYLEGPSCSFGTIRYEFNWEYRDQADGFSTSEGSLSLRGDGRVGAWAVSLGGEVNYEEKDEKTFDLSLIRAKYNDSNKLIIFGDSDIYLQKTLRDQNLRGILMISSESAFSRSLVPYTTVSGPAEPGDKVVLYINGKAFSETTVTPGRFTYGFNNVPLQLKRLNIIKVIIEKPSGEQLVTEQTLASSLNVLDPKTHEWMVAGGYYRYDDSEDWEDKLAVFKTKQSLGANIFLNSELVRTDDYNATDNSTETLYAADNGIAFKLGKNTIFALDWLVGGAADNLKQGWTADALYCLEKGFIESIIFYVDPTITEDAAVRTDPGKGFKLLGELAINDRVTYQAQAEKTDPINLAKMDEYISRYAEVERHYKHGENLQNLFTIGANHESDVAEGQTANCSQLYAQQSIFRKNSSSRNYLAGDYWEASDGSPSHGLEYELDYLKLSGDATLYSLSAAAIHSNGYQDYTQLELESSFKWFNRKRSATIYGSSKIFDSAEASDRHSTLDAATLGFWHKYFWNDEWSLYTGYEWNYVGQGNHYATTTINLTRKLPKRAGQYYGEFSYTSPYEQRTSSQYAYKIGVERHTKSGLAIKLEAAKIYESFASGNADRVYSLTCGQAIGFSGRRYKTIAADSETLSIVSGVVYLDENGNSQRDKNEKTLSNVRMSLNGRQATTDARGEYLYQYVEADSYKLYFDLRSLSADYTPIIDPILFKLKENENRFFDFGVTINGSISGRLFFDQNSNKRYDESDQPLDWVAVIIDNGKQKIFTGKDGIFYFENVPLGEHTIEVLTDTLPKDLVIQGKISFNRMIKENALDVKDIEIPVIYKFSND